MSIIKAGIDISDYSIEIVVISGDKNTVKLIDWSRKTIEPEVVRNGRIVNPNKLASIVEKMLENFKIDIRKEGEVIFGLPDNQVYFHSALVKNKKGINLDDLVAKEAIRTFPINEKELIFSYQELGAKSKNDIEIEVLIFAANQMVMLEWDNFFRRLGIEIKIFDIESLANGRGLFADYPNHTTAVVDIGYSSTNLAIYTNQGLRYFHSINIGKKQFVKKVSEKLVVDIDKANKAISRADLLDTGNETVKVLVEEINNLAAELSKDFKFYNSKSENILEKIVLIGGSSQIKNLAKYFTSIFTKLQIELGRPHILFKKDPVYYIKALGLALRTLDRKRDYYEPGFGRREKQKFNLTILGWINNIPLKTKLIILASIVFALLSGAAFISENKAPVNKQDIKEGFTSEIPFSIKDNLGIGMVSSTTRKIEILQNEPLAFGELVNTTRKIAENQIKDSEILWSDPLNLDKDSELIFPVTIEFMAINNNYINEMLTNRIKDQEGFNYDSSEVKIENLVYNNETKEIELAGNLKIKGSEKASTTLELIIRPELKTFIKIDQINSGLNIRSGPGTQYSIVGRASAGEEFKYKGKEGAWYQVELPGQVDGWIFAELAEIVNK